METLTTNVMAATGLDPAIGKAAIGHVLLFLRDEVPEGHVAEFIDNTPEAHEAVKAATATDDGGVTALIGGLESLWGHGRADVNILYGKLMNLGLDETQIMSLVKELVSQAETLIGADGLARVMRILSAERPVKPTRHRA